MENEKTFFGFYNKRLAYLAIGLMIFLGGITVSTIFYNYETGFWFDTPYIDSEDYYSWHPHKDDSCEELQSKLDLFHPDGINPVRFELLKAMFEKRCEVDLGK